MKRLRFILIGIAVFFAASCTKEYVKTGEADIEGELSFALSKVDAEIAVRSTGEDVPSVDEFRVAVYKKPNEVRLYNDSYANTQGKKIRLNAGDYTVIAQHGDSLGFGFDKPYYLAKEPFTIDRDNRHISVETTAKISNIKFDVTADEIFSQAFSEHYVLIRHASLPNTSVKFMPDETRAGYMPAGDVYVELYVLQAGAEKWQYAKMGPVTVAPNTFVHFSVKGNSDQSFTVTIDQNETITELPIELNWYQTPQDAPVITPKDFLALEDKELIYGQKYRGSYSIHAKAGIKECWLNIDSKYLQDTYGIPAEETKLVPLYNNTTKENYRNAGLFWDENMTSTGNDHCYEPSFINFDALLGKLAEGHRFDPEDAVVATITVRVLDKAGKESAHSFEISNKAIKSSLAIDPTDVWATKITKFDASASEYAEPGLFTLQLSRNGEEWQDVAQPLNSANGQMTFGQINGLDPGTDYKFRLIHNGNDKLTSNEVAVRTEDALQLGNSGFEDFHTEVHHFKYILSNKQKDWYLPWNTGESDVWWAVNSKKTLLDKPTVLDRITNYNYAVFPTCSWSSDAFEGNKSAQVASVATKESNTYISCNSAPKAGELWIGTASGSGDHASEGHAFASRPSELAFMYKYSPYGSKTGEAEVHIYNADNNEIAQKIVTDIPAADSWTKYSMTLDYSDTKSKAAKIYVIFRSANESGSGSGDVNMDSTIEMAGSNERAHIGSILKIDDLQLIYR